MVFDRAPTRGGAERAVPNDDFVSLIPRLIRAALAGDIRRVEAVATQLSRRMRPAYPRVAQSVADTLAQQWAGANPLRTAGLLEPPVDEDSRLSLVAVEEPALELAPVLSDREIGTISRFLQHWKERDSLISSGIRPATSLLLEGDPGVGKTYTGRFVASELELPLILLDVSTALSSYLGKSGHNLRTVLDYARSSPSVLFLDEFDAIAKRRDDPSDIGELKRVVSVLLRELESWPDYGIIVAATNHPELLDKAIFRRFDYVLEIHRPARAAREALLRRRLGEFVDGEDVSETLEVIAGLSDGLSAADVCKLADRAMRRAVLDSAELAKCLFEELPGMLGEQTSATRGRIVRAVRSTFGDKVSIREIANWVGVSPSTVHHHLHSGGREGE